MLHCLFDACVNELPRLHVMLDFGLLFAAKFQDDLLEVLLVQFAIVLLEYEMAHV